MRAPNMSLIALFCAVACVGAGGAELDQDAEPAPADWGQPGWKVGDTGLVVGGILTVDAEQLIGAEPHAELDAMLLAAYQASNSLRLFTVLEVGPLVTVDGGDGTEFSLEMSIERLHLDYAASDAFNLRFGKFLTPFGRWNQAKVEPLVWTTSEPLLVELAFDDSVTGAMLYGSSFPAGGELSYALYGSAFEPIDTDFDEVGSEHSLGARLEWASLDTWTLGASYFASDLAGDGWGGVGGADLLWQPTERFELSAETLAGRGSFQPGALSGIYVQAVYETAPSLYAVARLERFEPPGSPRAAELAAVGVVWAPRPRWRLKADYVFGSDPDDVAARGLRLSVSLLL